ncbi:MAG TPA: hypothetical protein VJJ26_05555 [Candidatus Babeliales bacterium]|nr:hypothetical protein [Candidatus Babeliales bacterium]
MKRPRTTAMITRSESKKLCLPQSSDPFLPIEIIEQNIRKEIVESFKFGNNTPKYMERTIKNIRAVNESWRTYFDEPNIIRTIISNASSIPCYRGLLAHSINLSSVKNYLNQSEELNCSIATIDRNKIKDLIKAGADINYCYQHAGKIVVFPILLMAQDDYDKTKLLLDLGADQNIACALTPLGFAMLINAIKFIQLFLEYHPRCKHVKEAIQTENLEIVQLILQQKDIPTEEIEIAKEFAIEQKNDTFIQLLNEYVNTQKNKETCLK